ncbi:MAG TPA: type II secretion system protein N [Noviherbaspirillum sp.]|uniref:type II secretion system protein N n=1 Tax=Noviherbaspirillum sp. TaxID=1926288 RepID=UPI002B4AA191|nr:type II secretion system protein N [Noviherbaspirillum sp.]HJV87236.1 type II secretion system protein N [Noviherbaspirillum sp.]
MKRLPLAASFLLFIALCASAAYWAMQLFKPPVRPVAAPPRAAVADVRPEAAASLFGGRSGPTAVASNYQLRGVIFSGSPHDSVAILSVDGKPAQAVRVDAEVAPGVKIKEVHREYVLLSDGGVTKRVDLPENAKGQGGLAMAPAPTPGRNGAAPNQSPAIGRPPQLTPPPAATPAAPAPATPTTAPPTVVVSPPPSQGTTSSGGVTGNAAAPAAIPTPVPAIPAQPVPQGTAAAPATPGTSNPLQSGTAVPLAPATPMSPPQSYTPFTGQVPPGTPGPNTPLQSR